MGRKIRSILLLAVLLILIYWQHSPVIYAEDARTALEERTGRTAGRAGKGGPEEGDIKTEDAGTEEAEKEGDEGEEGQEGREKEGETEEEEEGGTGGEVEKYELQYSEPDGRNGYYITFPEVRIRHVGKRGRTHYMLHNGREIMAEGEFAKEGEETVISEGQFVEGKNTLAVYMEDNEGNRIEAYDYTCDFLVDTKAPEFEMSAPKGFDAWYQEEAEVSVSASDKRTGSGVESISCHVGNEMAGTSGEAEGKFSIRSASLNNKGVHVTVTVEDKAGNKSGRTRKMYVDCSPPKMTVEGARDYMITGQPTLVACKVLEENRLAEWRGEVEWENPEGRKESVTGGTWTDEGGAKKFSLVLSKDGIYRIQMWAKDAAGHIVSQKLQIILDTQNPLIHHVDKLDGQHMKKFRWAYGKEEFIQDFTSYEYQVEIDDGLYSIGEEIVEEGKHVLAVEVADSAGNRAEARAKFTIDRTPPKVIFTDIEEEGVYEEKKSFQIALGSPEDKIWDIRINGVRQSLKNKGETYGYTVEEHKDYEVEVRAKDKAGNEAVSRIMFKIVPKETALQKITEPIRKIFLKKEKNEGGKMSEIEESQSHRTGKMFVVILAAIIGVSAMAVLYAYCRKR